MVARWRVDWTVTTPVGTSVTVDCRTGTKRARVLSTAAPQPSKWCSTLRATTPSAWTARVESDADGSNGTGPARSSSSGSACALSFLRTRPPKENRDEGQPVRDLGGSR